MNDNEQQSQGKFEGVNCTDKAKRDSVKKEILINEKSFKEFRSLCFSKNVAAVIGQQHVNAEHRKQLKWMTNRCQREICKENECREASDAAREEIFVVEATDAAVQEEIVMISTDDTSLAHVAVESTSGNVLATTRAAVSFASFRFVV